MNNMIGTTSLELTKKAVELLKLRDAIGDTDSSESESVCLIQELLANQILLEKQNEELRASKASIEQNYEIYQDIINNQPAGIYRICVSPIEQWRENTWYSSENPPYKMEMVTDRFCEIIGVSRQEFELNPFLFVDLICNDDKEGFIKQNEEANKSLIPFFWQGRLVIGEKVIWVRLESRPRPLVNGDVVWTGLLYDITKRKMVEETLTETRLKLDEVVESVRVGIAYFNIQTRELIFNQGYPKILGYTFDEIDGYFKAASPNTWQALIHPDDIQTTVEAHARYLRGEMPYYETECRQKHKDGHWVWMRQRGSITCRTPDGKPLILSAILEDISSRKQLEDELNQLNENLEKRIIDRTAELRILNISLQLNEEKFRTIADFTYDWEYWKSQEDEIIYMSPSVERITGYKAQEFVDDPALLDKIIHPNDQPSWRNHRNERMDHAPNDNRVEVNFRIITKDGQVRWLGHICRSIDVDGKYLGVRVSNRDITEKVEAQNELLRVAVDVEQRERNWLSSELHDGIGPLLSVIKLYFQWLSETDDVEKIKIITKKGNQSIESAIQSIRELARGLNSDMLIERGYVGTLVDFTKGINETQKISINFIFNSTDRFNHFQESSLYRITTELIKNTLTYAHASQIEISFNLDLVKNMIAFFYMDNGIGFDWAETEKEGAGLGLKNIKKRVQLMRGNLNIESKSGAGIKVYIEFPI
jgi:PAS domain S-box-containing protein